MPVVLAHTYHEAGTISSHIHVSPDDSPKANEPAYIHTQLTDTTGEFNAENCECEIKVFKEEEEIFSFRYNDIVDITFPEKGVYRIEFTGSPKNGAEFEQFLFAHEVRVEGSSQSSGTAYHMPILWCIGIFTVFVLGFVILKHVFKKS